MHLKKLMNHNHQKNANNMKNHLRILLPKLLRVVYLLILGIS